MLQVFESDAFPYQTGARQPANQVAPWSQTLLSLNGLMTVPSAPLGNAPTNTQDANTGTAGTDSTGPSGQTPSNYLYLTALEFDTNSHTNGNLMAYRFNGDTGAYIDSTELGVLGVFLGSFNIVTSYDGSIYALHNYAGNGNISAMDPTTMTVGKGLFNSQDFGLPEFNIMVQFSLSCGYLLNPSGATVTVYQISTKKKMYAVNVPANVVGCYMIDNQTAFVLCTNNVLVLLNYLTGAILNSYYFPPPDGETYWGQNNEPVWLYFYRDKGWLMVAQQVPNNVDGSNATKVYGYLIYPSATRLTTPIPLQSPVEGETIRVMTQLVDQMNHGIGGSVVGFKISNAFTAQASGMTDQKGRAYMSVNCKVAGTGAINCTATTVDQSID